MSFGRSGVERECAVGLDREAICVLLLPLPRIRRAGAQSGNFEAGTPDKRSRGNMHGNY